MPKQLYADTATARGVKIDEILQNKLRLSRGDYVDFSQKWWLLCIVRTYVSVY